MMNKLLLLPIACILNISCAFSQIDSSQNTASERGKYMLQLSLISHLENYNSADIGLIKNISNNRAIGVELGYIYDIYGSDVNVDKDWFKDGSGVKAYFQYRIYSGAENNYPSNSRNFFEIEPAFFFVRYNSQRIAGYSCNDEQGDCLYYRYFDSQVKRFVPGLNFKVGKMYDFNPFYVTIFGGLGMRYVFDQTDIPKEPEPDRFFFKNGQKSEIVSGAQLNLRVGIHVGYRFK
ncbi:hypothetical protein JKA74_06685 [Marivirga sp. S37H4]|uniref:DUF3575 domain-containing protein n=1 Tax=Marivirga aurantiaca TaxID=2802615 RepID=A0A935C829_9BACT|nr:hypothetical protein [Marivirga aurantiaca]MBK6264717.1 hypothetical protein [Marivirga aurantiaca]